MCEVGQQGQPVPVAKGWLRASHRKLDPERSLPYRPYHRTDERLWLKPGETVEVPDRDLADLHGVRERPPLRLDIQPRDGIGSAPYTHYHADYNAGAEHDLFGRGQGVVPAAADHSMTTDDRRFPVAAMLAFTREAFVACGVPDADARALPPR